MNEQWITARVTACALWLLAGCASDDSPAPEIAATGGSGGAGGAAGTTTGGAGGSGGTPIMDGSVGGAGGVGGTGGAGGAGGILEDAATPDADASDDAGSDAGMPLATCQGGPEPPATWQEHWFEHEQLLTRVYVDDCVAVYFDDDVNRDEAEWLFEFISRRGAYSLATYGAMGEDRLYAIFHEDKYGGGHPSYWYDDSHDNRNVTDQGGGDWREGNNYDVASHEVAHIVESTAPYPRRSSPAFGLWHDSKWAEIYQYDLYLALGMTEHAEVVFDRFDNAVDDFPRAGTRWFHDWFYPLWRDHGGARVMSRFFALLEEHGVEGGMNWGEYVHFTSGAAGTDVKALATAAFGWPDEWEQEWQAARTEYPGVTY